MSHTRHNAAPIVGIDLGTTNSLVAVVDGQGVRVLGDEPIMPSVVRFEAVRGCVVVGQQARDEALDYPSATIFSAKRLMGRSAADVAGEASFLPYAVVAGEHNTARVRVPIGEGGGQGEMIVSPQEVSAHILRELGKRASEVLGVEVQRAVVTVPAYFDDAQRQATRDAGRLAGLEVVRIVNEPTAAALAYGIGLGSKKASTIAVYDLGGGTFDISILRVTPATSVGEPAFYQVLATAGDTKLGGDDVDHALVSLFVREIVEQFGLKVRGSEDFEPRTRRALISFAQGVKHRLSDELEAKVLIDLGVGRGEGGRNVYERVVGRDEFEEMVGPWVEPSLRACQAALQDAKIQAKEVDAVVMVGGSTRMPIVQRLVGELFEREPYTAIDPDWVVALGAAIQASILSGDQVEGSVGSSLLLDVIPLSLGVETVGGAVAKLIMRNSSVPARATEMFSTSVDGQVSIKISVYQGEREMARDCRLLGTFELTGIPPMPAGIPQLQVDFLVDANGVLRVSAHERRSGKQAQLQVVPNHGLTQQEVECIERESFAHAQQDMDQHRVVDLIVNARLDLKWIGERLNRHASTLEPEYCKQLEQLLTALGSFVEKAQQDYQSVDANAFYQAKQALDEASVRLQEVSIAHSLRADAENGTGEDS